MAASPNERCYLHQILVDRLKHAPYIRAMTEIVDALGMLCPLPVLKARKRLKTVPAGGVLRLLADDPAAVIDVPHFCSEAGHEFLGSGTQDGAPYFDIKKAV